MCRDNMKIDRKIIGTMGIIFLLLMGGVMVSAKGPQGRITRSSDDELDEKEIAGLLFMREEEKLARDVYLTLYQTWNQLPIFNNIANSEQIHMDAIKRLLDKYGLSDPTEDMGVGEFQNMDLQVLYLDLIQKGSSSLVDALETGAAIEEIDIIDLKNYLAETDQWDIQRVYNNLLEGSKNHLRAFVSALAEQGITYEPQYLSQEEFDEIIDEDTTTKGFGNLIQNIKQLRFHANMKNMLGKLKGTGD
jgi:hypothetical protein